jgi:uroporphyrinogen-III synthase
MSGSKPLAGRGIVITRPSEQSLGLARLVEAEGGRALVFPALEIEDVADPGPLHALVARLEEFDLAIFVSPNAVRKTLAIIRARRGEHGWPPGLRAAAVGAGSRAALVSAGIREVLAPESGADSEALLALPELGQVSGRRIVIFRGEGGRELLAETLTHRGALVQYAQCYRRSRPRADAGSLLGAWERGAVHAITVSSTEGLRNLFTLLGSAGERRLRETPLFVPHARVAEEARRLGVQRVHVAGPADEEMLAALVAYFGRPT